MGDNRGISPMRMNGNIAENWQMWRSRFENYLKAAEVTKKSEEVQCAQLLHYIGKEGFKIYKTFGFTEEEKNKLKPLLEKFEVHFLPKANLSYERYIFFTMRQQSVQSLEQFIITLKEQAQKCHLEQLEDGLIKCMIICGVRSPEIREKLLQDDSLTLEKVIQQCKIMEMAKEQSKEMESEGDNSNIVGAVNYQPRRNFTDKGKHFSNKNKQNQGKITSCTKCGKSHDINKCPAYGKFCSTCKKKNHFSVVCKNKKFVQEVEQGETVDTIVDQNASDPYMFLGSIEINAINDDNVSVWNTDIIVNNKKLKLKVDTGAMCNVLSVEHLKMLNLLNIPIKSSGVRLRAYTGDSLKVIGVCNIQCKKNNENYNLEFFIVESNTQAILGLSSCIKLKVIKKIESVSSDNYFNEITTKYSDVFTGIGCLSKPYSIKLKENVRPVVHPTRRVALPLLPKLKHSLVELEKQNIIKKVEEATDWVNALVITKKPNGSLRICLDPKDLNENIQREQCLIPTIDEITSKMTGATIFSTLDATCGFYQVVLDEASSDLCVFGTPFGRYKFLRLPYGIKSAPEVFQQRFREVFRNCEGTEIYIDDLIVWGKDQQEHDLRLKQVMETAKINNVKFNKEKCHFGKSSIKYMGHIISKEGVSPDESKIEAIKNLTIPTCKEDVQRVLGMLTYVSKFIPNFSCKSEPLRSLLKKDTLFTWGPLQQKSFDTLKSVLSTSSVLQFFDVNKDTVVSVDSSKSGVCTVLLQNNLPCAYASKALTQAQERYAQIEKEMAAICFGLNRFHEYIFSKRVRVETDHQPLITILKKPLNKCPARLQRMLLQVQKYDIEVCYRPGKQLVIADALSRAYINDKSYDNFDNELQAQVCLVVSELNVTDEKL